VASPYLGQILLFAGNFNPRGYAQCNGQLIAISQNDALYSLIGTTYGGDGVTAFGLPDLRGRVPVHQGSLQAGVTYVIGQSGGAESVELNSNQIPSHTHAVNASTAAGTRPGPAGNVLASGVPMYIADGVNHTLDPGSVQLTGSSQTHSNMQPSLAITFLIALSGIYPSQT
jgi:microcystin-dependent protein